MYGVRLVLSRLLVIGAVAMFSYAFLQTAVCRCQLANDDLPELQISDAQFGIEMWDADAGYIYDETDTVVLEPGTSFGWRIRLKNPVTTVRLTEEFVLPAPPSHWGLTRDTHVTNDGRVAVTHKDLSPNDGWIDNGWVVTEGDPEGLYEMRIYLDGDLVQTFRFNGVKP